MGYTQKSNSDTEIKIGLLVTDNESVAAQNGALLALEEANKKYKSEGFNYKLLVRSMEGPWGTGSKETVNLVFNDKVWAIMGSHDGRNAHLVEQVITKTHIVFLSARATDPTLSQAFVPWFFNLVPNDLQQADILIKEFDHLKGIQKITVISDNTYDSNLALQQFQKRINTKSKVKTEQLSYNSSDKNYDNLPEKINKSRSDGIVLFGNSSAFTELIQKLKLAKNDSPVFGTLSFLSEDKTDAYDYKNYYDIAVITSVNWLNSINFSFAETYQKKYRKIPGAVAAYAYDGINLIIETIRHSGFDREKIQETMSGIELNGVTGLIKFDEHGNRKEAGELTKISNRIPVSIEK
jgi:branched-chain amino acid transport system substrate-binding protein